MENDEYERLQDATMLRLGSIADKVERGEISIEDSEADIASMLQRLEQAKDEIASAQKRSVSLKKMLIFSWLASVVVALILLRLVA